MWLLLVAAGTGYLARCWQKTRMPKSKAQRCRHMEKLHSSQRSPSCTPKRGRSVTSSWRTRRRRSHSANRWRFHEKREGGVRISSPLDKSPDDSVLGEDTVDDIYLAEEELCRHEPGEVQCLNQSTFLSRKMPLVCKDSRAQDCVQDWWKELSRWNLKLSLPIASTNVEKLKGISEPNLSKCKLSIQNTVHGTVHDNLSDLFVYSDAEGIVKVSETNSCKLIPRVVKGSCKLLANPSRKKKFSCTSLQSILQQPEQSTKAYLPHKPTKEESFCRRILLKRSSKDLPSLRTHSAMCPSPPMGHSCLLNALLDPEYDNPCYYNHCETFCTSTLEGSCMKNRKCLKASPSEDTPYWEKPCNGVKQMAAESPMFMGRTSFKDAKRQCRCSKEGSRSIFGIGVGVGVMLMSFNNRSELGTLISLMKETQSLIRELKEEVESISLTSPSKAGFDDKKILSDRKLPVEEKHQELASDSCRSCMQQSPLELFDSHNDEGIFAGEHMNGIVALEAELEAELQRMELGMYAGVQVRCQKEQGIAFEEVDVDMAKDMENGGRVDSEFAEDSGSDLFIKDEDEDEDEDEDGDDIQIYLDNRCDDQLNDDLYECHYPVSPRELERRLWHVVEQRQEQRISELESTLQLTSKNLSTKEVEVQWWKDRVGWLMEASCGGKEKVRGVHHQHPPPGAGIDASLGAPVGCCSRVP